MKTWRWMMVMLFAGSIAAACTVEEKQPSDDDGSSSSSGNSVSSSSSNASSSVSSSASTASGAMCDTGEAGQFTFQEEPCVGCAVCAIQGNCAADVAKCPSFTGDPTGTDCDNYLGCARDCIDTCDATCMTECATPGMECDDCQDACSDGCIGDSMNPVAGTCLGDFSQGADDYIAMLSCIVCVECPNNCDGVNLCGPAE